MKIIDSSAVKRSLSFPRLVEALRSAFRDGATAPLRHAHSIESAGTSGISLIMPAWDRQFYGVKIINIFPHNAERHLPGLHATYVLFDAETGVPLALIDGDVLTAYRTAAAAALGASFLARDDARSLFIVGSGRVASLIAQAMSAVRPIETVKVWSRNPANRDALTDALSAEGFNAAAASLDEAYDADIISCSTLSGEPLIRGNALRPGTHLDLIGSFAPDMREADGECFRRSTIFIDTDEAPKKAGDLLSAVAEGCMTASGIAATFADLCAGRHPGRTSPEEITVLKAVGTALEDLAAANLAYNA